jgi:hypothetical protein
MTKSISLGATSMTAIQLERAAQVNKEGFGSKFDPVDDLFGALA